MSTNVAASFGSYPHPFCGSRATRIRMYPSASQSEQRTVSSTRPFTGNEASNSRPDLIGWGTTARTAAAPINPTTRELQVVAGLYTSEQRGNGIREERLVHNYLVEAGLAARIPKGIRIWEETLRDGEQTPGVAYTPEEKMRIARLLDEVHVPMMDVGIPVVSSEEARGVRMIANAGLDATIMAAARTVRKDVEACIACDVDEIALFTAGSDLHIKHKLAMTRDQVKAAAVRETEYAVAHGVDVSFVTEDTFRADLDFVVDLYDACTAACSRPSSRSMATTTSDSRSRTASRRSRPVSRCPTHASMASGNAPATRASRNSCWHSKLCTGMIQESTSPGSTNCPNSWRR